MNYERRRLTMLKTVKFLYRTKHLQLFFLMSITSRPNLSEFWEYSNPNTIHVVDLQRATYISAGNQTPYFVRFRVKLVRNTHELI